MNEIDTTLAERNSGGLDLGGDVEPFFEQDDVIMDSNRFGDDDVAYMGL